MSLFGSSGIRGVVGQDFTIELAVQIGAAVGNHHGRVIVGTDSRTSGDMVTQALVAGVTSAGGTTYDAGLVSTPTLARAASDFDCGIMVTASHNPPQYNGVKLWNSDGSAFDSSQMDDVEDLIVTETFAREDWRHVGKGFDFAGATSDHIEAVLRSVGSASAKVVLDCGNGATCGVSPYVLRGLGCEVTTLNCQADGHFPGRSSEPTEDQLSDLKELVVKKGADLGIAHDGDGDRMVAIDDKGRFVDGDRLLALFTSFMGAKGVVAPIDASMILNTMVQKVIRCRVGDVYVAEALKESELDFGGEPSGTYIFPRETYCPDGVYAGALLAKMASERSLSEMIGSLPSFPVHRESHRFDAHRRAEVERALATNMAEVECDELLTLDGFRAQFPDGWFLVRLSGTEPKVRLTVEARDDGELRRLAEMARCVVEGCLR